MLRHAFKEWAVICAALAQGKQAIVIRKGGIAESSGLFVPEHVRFWLYPTYVHQQETGIKPELLPLLEEIRVLQPPSNVCRLQHFAEVSGVYHVAKLDRVLALDAFHGWSQTTIQSRFEYRAPGIFVMPVRIYAMPVPVDIPVEATYEGCKTWVELTRDLPTHGAEPVLSEDKFQTMLTEIEEILDPSAIV